MNRLPGDRHHEVGPGPVVELGPVVRMTQLAGGPSLAALRVDRLPVSTTSLWTRPPLPDPGDVPMRLHFELKAELGFEHAVIERCRIEARRPSRVGDRIGHFQRVRSIGPPTSTALGPGRRWEVDHVLTDESGEVLSIETFAAVGYVPQARSRSRRRPRPGPGSAPGRPAPERGGLTDRGLSVAAAACRVWAPVHHDPMAATRAGLPGVIACTQQLVTVLERSALESAEPGSTVRSLELHMRRPVTTGPALLVTIRPGASQRERQVTVSQSGSVRASCAVQLG